MSEYTVEIAPAQADWNAAVAAFPEANFLHAWEWGEFEVRLHKSIERLLVRRDDRVVAVVQLSIEPAKRGTYAAVAGGPLIDWHDVELVQFVFAQIAEQARQHHCWYIRFRPQELETAVSAELLRSISARPAPMHLTADLTLQLDLSHTPEELLGAMRKNTRSDIRKAERLGIVTKISTDENEVRRFYEEQLAVAEKHKFVPFSYEFLHEQFSVFAAADAAFLVHAYLEEQLLATAFIIAYNGEAVYHYGISTEANAHFPGSAATQWRAITEAQTRGCKRYNFWGIAPAEQKEHRFAGVSLFKRGFGGQEVAYLPAHDIALSPLYWGTWIFETLRRKARHL